MNNPFLMLPARVGRRMLVFLLAFMPFAHGQWFGDDFEGHDAGADLGTSGPWDAVTAGLPVRDENTAAPFGSPNQFLDWNDASDAVSLKALSPNIAAAAGAVTTYAFTFREPSGAADGRLVFGYTQADGDLISTTGRLLVNLDDGLIAGLTTTAANSYSLDTPCRVHVVFNDTAATVIVAGESIASEQAGVWIQPVGGPLAFAGTRDASNTPTSSYRVGFRSYNPDIQQVFVDDVSLHAGVVLPTPDPSSKDSIVGRAQASADPVGYYPDASSSTVGIGGASGSRTDRQVVLGFTLPNLPAGTTLGSADFNFEITAYQNHSGADPALDVYLLDTADPDSSGTDFFYHGPDDPNPDTTFVGTVDLSEPQGGQVNYGDDEQDQTMTLSGDALALLQGFYGGDHIPERTEVFFRFNLDNLVTGSGDAGLDGSVFDRYFIDLGVGESGLELGATELVSPTEGLIVHLDASSPGSVSVDGSGNVTSWADLTVNGNDAVPTPGDAPVTFPSENLSDKGLAGVDSDHSTARARMDLFSPREAQDGWLDFAGSAGGNSGFAILVAVQCDSFLGGSVRDVVMANHGTSPTSADHQLMIRCEQGTMMASLNGTVLETGSNLAAGRTVVLALNYDAATGETEFWDSYNDTPVTAIVPAGDFTGAGPMRLFGSPNGDQGMDGMIGEVKIYSRLLAGSEFVSEREAMKAKWADDFVPEPTMPIWWPDTLLAWDPQADPDAPFYRSTVALRERFEVLPALKANGNARSGQGGIQSLDTYNPGSAGRPAFGRFTGGDAYAFTYWQYVEEAVQWGGSAGEGIIVPPTAEMIDAAHRNGVPILGTVFFPWQAIGGRLEWVQDFVQDDGNGNYPVADKLIEVAEFIGFDGWFINQEYGATAAEAAAMRDMIRYIRENSDLRISWYDAMNESGAVGWQDQLNTNNDWYLRYPENPGGNRIADSIFLDYVVNATTVQSSRNRAIDLGLDPYKIFSGFEMAEAPGFKESTGPRQNISTAFPDGLDHVTSAGLFIPGAQAETLADQDLFWTGSSGDPRDTSTTVGTGNWHGIAHHIAARSPIDSLPFATDFSIGRGERFNIDGVTQLNNAWWNRSLQPVLPTWRWIIDSVGSELVPELWLGDSYQGGNCLRLSGDLDAVNTLRLYLMDLPVSSDTKVKIVFKYGDGSGSGPDAAMEVGVSMASAPTAFTYYDVGGHATGWNEVVIDLGSHAGERIAALNLRFGSGASLPLSSYEMRVGMMAIYDESEPSPEPVSNVRELDIAVRSNRIDGKVAWDHAPGDVSYYNVYLRSAGGSLSYVGSTPNNHFYFGNKPYFVDFGSVVVETVGAGFVRSVLSDETFEAWSGGEPFDGDFNRDGVSDGIAFLLGAPTMETDARDLLPTAEEVSGGLKLTFTCRPVAERGGALLTLQHSGDLGVTDPWVSAAVPDASSGPINGVNFVVSPGPGSLHTVEATIEATEAADGRLFGRLHGTQ
ncbi:hypothetical protein [Haloferula sp. A504]|uniref:endo-beta-N-acetylglucosaminidase n=1 Tax=Haloferula sp. A504 TaxID=3373601 RepID=UPI0031BE7F55|nr:hypothetical protein [Verrucomicrobiaceae bacterium E54]